MQSRGIVSAESTPSQWGQVDLNLAQIAEAAERAADDHARLLLLPECCLTGANWPEDRADPPVEQVALGLGSAPMREVARLARRTGVILAVGLWEKCPGGRVHITQALVGPGGLLGAYRKVHEGRHSSREKDLFPVFDLGFARVGVSICYDNCFPECARILALKGAEILLAPFTSLPLTRAAWRLERLVPLCARAQDNRLFVISASHARPHVPGRPGEWGYSGICCAIDPLGRVIAESRGRTGRPQRLTVTLEERLRRTYLLAHVPGLRNRRPADYAALTNPSLQLAYLASADAYAYNDHADVWTCPKRRRSP